MSLNCICSPQGSFFYYFFYVFLSCFSCCFFPHVPGNPWLSVHILERRTEELVWIFYAILKVGLFSP